MIPLRDQSREMGNTEQQPERMEPFVFGQSATPGASSGGGGAAGKLDSKKTYAASLHRRPPDGEAVVGE